MVNDLSLALMTGIDIPIPECNIVIHQPIIKEISFIGEKEYFLAIQTLCLDKRTLIDNDEEVLDNISNFKIFMMILNDKQSIDKKQAVKQTFSILFPNYTVIFSERSLSFFMNSSSESTAILIDETNFDFLQNVLRQIACLNHNSMQKSGFNPQDARAKEIADKIMKARSKIAAQKKTNEENSLLGQYVSTLTIGVHSMSLSDCLNLTMYQLFDLIERYSLYAAWDIDIRVRLAGGKTDKEPDNWMKNIH